MATRPYCFVCKHNIRNAAEHNQSAEHKRKLNPHRHVTKAERRRARSRQPRVTESDTKVSVRQYRRSLPNDGRAKVVRVRHYWRNLFRGYGGGVTAAAIRRFNALLAADR